MQNAFLKGEKVSLRMLEDEDFYGPYLTGINDQKFDQYTDHALFPKDVASLKAFAESKKRNGDLWLGVFDNATKKHVGNIELSQIGGVHRKALYAILFWDGHGKGLAYEASHLMIKFAFEKYNLHRIELYVHQENEKAVALYNRLGFVKEGVMREAFLRGNQKSNLVAMGLLRSEFKP